MRKLISILSLLTVALLIIGCKGASGLSKADVDQMIKDSQKNGGSGGASGNSSISDILETAVTEVSGKVWTVTRNVADAGTIGGKKDAGFDHEITFDKESFTFSISMKDGGISSKDETVNNDYMDLVKTGVAELKDGKLVCKNRMYIKGVYLPKLSKWLSLDGKEYSNTGPLGNSEDPFNKYFKDGYHQGYPNLVLDVELEVKGTGSDRFRNVDNLATLDHLRLVIKDGKLKLVKDKEKPEQSATLDKSYINSLMYNYYGDSDAEFGCADWPPFKEDTGKYTTDVSTVQAALNALKTEMRDPTKRKQPTSAEKWGYTPNGSFSATTDVDLVFDANKIVAVVKKIVPNPEYKPDLPESSTNPKELEVFDTFAPLFTAQPDPDNSKEAHAAWATYDTLKTTALAHPSLFKANDFDTVKNAKVSWRVLYGTAEDSTPATITVTRTVRDVTSVGEASDIAGTKYRSNTKKTVSDFDANNANHWELKNHKGTVSKYKVDYTMSVKFDNISDSFFTYDNDFKTKALSSNEFEVKYTAVTGTTDAEFDWVYTLESYSVMEKAKKQDMWLTFAEVELYGKITTQDGTEGAVEKLTPYLKRPITGDTVLKNQTHFFVPSVLPDGRYISKITRIKIIPNMENVRFDVTSDGSHLSLSDFFEARINKDNANSIDTSQSDGYEEFYVASGELEVSATNGFEKFKGNKLIITLSGLGEHTTNRKGHNRSSTNKTENWQSYSFVIHFGK